MSTVSPSNTAHAVYKDMPQEIAGSFAAIFRAMEQMEHEQEQKRKKEAAQPIRASDITAVPKLSTRMDTEKTEPTPLDAHVASDDVYRSTQQPAY